MVIFIGAGVTLRFKYEQHPVESGDSSSISTTTFIIPEQPPPPAPVPVEEKVETPKEQKRPPEVIDLTKVKPSEQAAETPQEQTEEPQENIRQVYGLNRVYSSGLGSGGSMSDAVIGRLGNTTDKDFDTLTATEHELQGRVVSAATVSSAPRFKRQVRPEYTQEMLEKRVEGVIRVRVLVDIDGKVKNADLLNDLGYDSGERALEAVLQMEFYPAMRDDEPVAVWIVVPIRFMMLG